MNRHYIITLLILLLLSCKTYKIDDQTYVKKNPNSLSIKLTNGNWFNGKTFTKRTVWIREGILHFSPIKEKVDTVIDLSNKYAIPPFAEAHNHNLESSYELDKRIKFYMDNGVFYVKHLSAIKKRLAPLMHRYNHPEGIDLSTTYAPLTGTGGHPVALRERFFDWGRFRGVFNTKKEIESHGYFIIDSEQELEEKWPHVLSFSPEFIKFMVIHSEEYEKRKNDTTFFGQKGLNPLLVPKVIEKSHANNLRVSAHVDTAYDFHIAVSAGADEIAHLPEIYNGKLIKRKDAALAKKNGTIVVTTASLVLKRQKRPNYQKLLENISSNLRILKEEGVTIALGSDMYNDNSVGEFKLLHKLNVFSNLELLKISTENATKTIFPNRKIGKLRKGYEASFLILNKNPLEDISEIHKTIITRVKQGVILD